MATFITDSALREVLTSANTHAGSALPAHWEPLVPLANQRGYNRLRSLFLGRGLTATQFASWGSGSTSDGVDWNKRFSVVFAFIEASKADPDGSRIFREELKELIEEFKEFSIVIDGVRVYGNRCGTGDFDTTDDRFLLDAPDGTGDFSAPTGTVL